METYQIRMEPDPNIPFYYILIWFDAWPLHRPWFGHPLLEAMCVRARLCVHVLLKKSALKSFLAKNKL
jgi:hypothetical protein